MSIQSTGPLAHAPQPLQQAWADLAAQAEALGIATRHPRVRWLNGSPERPMKSVGELRHEIEQRRRRDDAR